MATPAWAVEYESGHLDDLGLQKMMFETSDPIPGYAAQPGSDTNQPSIGAYLWTLLARVPGGKMTVAVLIGTIEEWMETKFQSQSYRSRLTRAFCFVNDELPAEVELKSRNCRTWRVATIVEEAEKKAEAEKECKLRKQQKRIISALATQQEVPASQAPQKRVADSAARTKLPSDPSSVKQKRNISVLATQQEEILAQPPRKRAADNIARTKLPSNPSPIPQWTPINSRVSSKSSRQQQNEEPHPSTSTPVPKTIQPEQNNETHPQIWEPSAFSSPAIILDEKPSSTRAEPEPEETFQVLDDASEGSSEENFFDDKRPPLTLHLQNNTQNIGVPKFGKYRGPCEISSGRCNCRKWQNETKYGYQKLYSGY